MLILPIYPSIYLIFICGLGMQILFKATITRVLKSVAGMAVVKKKEGWTHFSGTDDSGRVGLGIISTGPTTGLMTPDQLHTHTNRDRTESHYHPEPFSSPALINPQRPVTARARTSAGGHGE